MENENNKYEDKINEYGKAVIDQIDKIVEDTKTTAGKVTETVKDKALSASRSTVELVKENPVRAVLVIAGVGALLAGAVVTIRSRRRGD